MKILFVQPTGDKRGHYGLWTSKLCQATAKHGEDLTLVTNKLGAEKYLNEKSEFRLIEVRDQKYAFDRYDKAMEQGSGLFWYGYFRNTFVILKYALKLCKKEKFDVLYLTDVEYLTASLLLKWYRKHLPPVVWHVQAANFSYDSYLGSRLKKLYKVFQRSIFSSTLNQEVKGFAVLGEYHRKKLKEQLNLTDNFGLEVIPDGADIYINTTPQPVSRQEIGLSYSGFVFLFFGMLRKDKGLQNLIEAASLLSQYDFKIVIAGAPFEWSKAELSALISQYKLEEKVELHSGYVPDHKMASYYLASDAVIFPYNASYTGSCGPLTKGACSYERPVIVTDVSDLGRVVREYQNGLIANPGEAGCLAEAMEKMLNLSSTEQAQMKSNVKLMAKQHTWETVSRKFIHFIKECASHGTV